MWPRRTAGVVTTIYKFDANDRTQVVSPASPGSQLSLGARGRESRESFAVAYARYGRHTMVADENYFATTMKNSRFCHTHENTNFLHVQFDQYEHQKASHKAGQVVQNKCLMPNPNHCGRSPTVVTKDFLPVLDLADAMFARKFDPAFDEAILDAVDLLRTDPERIAQRGGGGVVHRGRFGDAKGPDAEQHTASSALSASRDGGDRRAWEYHPAQEVRFALRPRTRKDPLLCLSFTDRATALTQCLPPKTRSKAAMAHQLMDVGPCSRDGELKLDEDTGIIVATRGPYSQPYCQIKPSNQNACMDVEREQVKTGARIIKWGCRQTKWNQLFSFTDLGQIFINIPMVEMLNKRMCLQPSTWKDGSDIRIMPCSDDEPLQRFFVINDDDDDEE